jgi:hypothetical protein
MTVYLAGPMTGLPDHNYPAFHAEADRLRRLGYQVANPANNGDDIPRPWRWYVAQGLAQLVMCDAVALLPGWEHSRGACIEVAVADLLEIPVVPSIEVQERTA